MISDAANSKMLANAIRALAMDSVEKAKSGHPGLPMGAADIVTALFTKILKYNPKNPAWPDRDRFILSAGHGSMLLYSLLYLTGYQAITIEQLQKFRQLGSLTPGHPEVHHTPGVETTTGPLGQGIATAVGMALAERMAHAQFGDIVDHYTYVLASDGDLMEGVSQEAIAIAGHLNLSRMIVLWDNNGISIDGPINLSDTSDQLARFGSVGWNVQEVDGHNHAALVAALEIAKAESGPSFIACKTTIGFGAPTKAGTSKAHGEPLGTEELAGARKILNWPYPPFEIPEEILNAWRAYGARGEEAYEAWQQSLSALPINQQQEFKRRLAGALPNDFADKIAEAKQKLTQETSEIATRKASEQVLTLLTPHLPELITGSADLTPSNNTKVPATADLSRQDYSGRYIHWGIREHGMAAAINGLTLHGGFIASGATFLVFSDYCRPALRLSALMRIGSIEVFTHDSIGLGEDGPTHQPVEHLAALRAIPHMRVFRPCDRIETLETWQIALESRQNPSCFALTRQNLPLMRTHYRPENLSARGAYELIAAKNAKVTLFATGSELSLAVEASVQLNQQGIATRVVSMPCMELFAEQSPKYIAETLGNAPVRIAVEAGIRLGWDRWIGPEGIFVGMSDFGASGPYKTLYQHFNITSAQICAAALQRLS